MKLLKLIFREIMFRKTSFYLGIAAVAVATGVFAGYNMLEEAQLDKMDEVRLQKMKSLQSKVFKIEMETRDLMDKLGFNITILPEDQNLGDYHSEGYAEKTMPETYIKKLIDAEVITIDKLTARLKTSIKWPEKKIRIIIVGEAFPEIQRPVLPPVHTNIGKVPRLKPKPSRPGVNVGYELARSQGLKQNQVLTFMGREFLITEILKEEATEDDITLYFRLDHAQTFLGKQGLINEISAEQCRTFLNRLDKVREEIQTILPGVQVLETGTNTLARFHALNKVKQKTNEELSREYALQQEMREKEKKKYVVLQGVTGAAVLIWLFFLSARNIKQRKTEIGAFRSMGCSVRFILAVLLARPLLIGAAGGVIGAGAAIAVIYNGYYDVLLEEEYAAIAVVSVVGAVGASLLTGLFPTLRAVFRDPASVLRGE